MRSGPVVFECPRCKSLRVRRASEAGQRFHECIACGRRFQTAEAENKGRAHIARPADTAAMHGPETLARCGRCARMARAGDLLSFETDGGTFYVHPVGVCHA